MYRKTNYIERKVPIYFNFPKTYNNFSKTNLCFHLDLRALSLNPINQFLKQGRIYLEIKRN